MKTLNCAHCQGAVIYEEGQAGTAATCPHCTNPILLLETADLQPEPTAPSPPVQQPELLQSPRPANGLLLSLLVILVSVSLATALALWNGHLSEKSDRDQDRKVYDYITNRITSHLVAPATTKFCSFAEAEIHDRKIKGFLDTQNQFGALIRLDFEAEVSYSLKDVYMLRVVDRLGQVHDEFGYWPKK
jgi:hypothetical protein